jgi:chromate transporter
VAAPSLGELTIAVARDVNRTVGGGHAAIELLRRTFTTRGWFDAPAHGLLVAVSRLTPGTNVLAYCVTLGWRFYGTAGALAALGAASVPASFIVFALTAALVRVDRYRAVQAVLAIGILAASVLVLASAWNLIRPYLGKAPWPRLAFVAAIAVVLSALGATPVRTLLAAAVAGILLPPLDARR